MAITGAPSTVANLGDLFPKIYQETLFVIRAKNLMAGLVTNVTGQGVASRYIPLYNEITASSVAEGGTPTAQQLSKGTADTITVSYIRTKVGLTDQRQATDPDNGVAHVSQEGGMAIAKKIDQDLLAEFANFSNTMGAAGSALTLKRTAAAIAILQSKNAFGKPNVVLHPFAWNTVYNELTQNGVTTRAANASDVVNAAMRDYLVNTEQGADWYISNNIGTGTAAVHGAFVREAIELDTRLPVSQKEQRDEDSSSWYIYHNAWYGTGTPRADFGVKITADASLPTGN